MNRFSLIIVPFLFVLLITTCNAQNIVKQIARFDNSRRILVLPEKFLPYENGFQLEGEIIHCDNGTNSKTARGATQTILLNQIKPDPIRVELSSKAENVSGTPSGELYGLYIDIIYTDGSPLWGQTAAFETGTHDWETKTMTIYPEKPIRSLMLYAMFRNKSGKVAFKDMKVQVQSATKDMMLFDGTSVTVKKKAALQIRDVAGNSDFMELQNNPFGVNSTVKTEGALTKVTLTNSDDKDRCLSLVYAIDVPAEGLQWCENPRTHLPVEPNTEYMNASPMPGIGNERLSLYPFAAVANSTEGFGIGIDMSTPAFFRTGYHSGTGELFVVCDIALTKESPTATIHFVRMSFDPQLKFRGALDAYYRLFLDSFTSRTPKQGVWMPFHQISKVPNHEDFGFQFKEGTDEIAWDDAHNITTFRYTEPGTWWMAIPDSMPQTYESAISLATKMAGEKNPRALALFASGMQDTKGQLCCQILDTPWSKGAVWSMNDMPEIPGGGFSLDWNPQIYKSNYEGKSKAILDGEYIDSSEAYVTAPLDYNRKNFLSARTPLTFSTEKRPAIFKGLVVFEYIRKIAEDMHRAGKLMMGNSTPDRYCWLAPMLDVLGTETDWNRGGQWNPMSDSAMLYRRALCGAKPFCFLMNTDFSKFSYDLSERFMKRCLAYGMFPGYFSADAATGHYFSRPELYERDRPLFKKYIPLCKLVAEAGWQPITLASSSDPKVYVECFGYKPNQTYYTVFNDTRESKTATIRFEMNYKRFKDLVSEKDMDVVDGAVTLTLPPESVAVLQPVR